MANIVDLPCGLQCHRNDSNVLVLSDFTEPSPLRYQCADKSSFRGGRPSGVKTYDSVLDAMSRVELVFWHRPIAEKELNAKATRRNN
jgi:hypothetical protein